MEVLTVLGFDPNARTRLRGARARRPGAAAAYWVAGADADSLSGAAWPLTEVDAEALLGELPGGLKWFLEAVAEWWRGARPSAP